MGGALTISSVIARSKWINHHAKMLRLHCPALVRSESVFVCVCVYVSAQLFVCKLICSSTQACISVFVHIISGVLWGILLEPFLAWFTQLMAAGFLWHAQLTGMQLAVTLNCNKLNVIQLKEISLPFVLIGWRSCRGCRGNVRCGCSSFQISVKSAADFSHKGE